MMRRHTLKEFEKHYNPDTIQLIFAKHIVNIDLNLEGSSAIYRAFEDYKFDLLTSYDEKHKHLILTY